MVKKKLILILTNTTAFTGGVITTMAVAACSIQRLTKSNLEAQIENLRKINNDLGHQKKYEYDQYLDIAKKAYDTFIENSGSANEKQKSDYKENALKNIEILNREFKNVNKTKLEDLKTKIQKIKITVKKIEVKPTEKSINKKIVELPNIKSSSLYLAGGDLFEPYVAPKINSKVVEDFNLDLSDAAAIDFLYNMNDFIKNATDSGLYNYNSAYNGRLILKESIQWLLDNYENERKEQNLSEVDYYVKPTAELIFAITKRDNIDNFQYPITYLEFLISNQKEHKILLTPHAKIFLKRLYFSLKEYNHARKIDNFAWYYITNYLRWTVIVNGYRHWGPDKLNESAYSLFLSNINKTDLVDRFKDVYLQLKENFWDVKPFHIDTESDQHTVFDANTSDARVHILDGKEGIASKYPNRDDIQNSDTRYHTVAVITYSQEANGPHSESSNLYSYGKNSGLEYVRLQLGTAELAKIKNKVIQNRHDYEHDYDSFVNLNNAVNDEEKEEIFKQAFFYPSMLPDIQVGYIDPYTNEKIYFDGIIKSDMSKNKTIPENANPLLLKDVISKYLNEKWDKYQSLMPPHVVFNSPLRKLSSERYERLRLALATLELDFDQSEYTLADLLGSSVKANSDKIGLYNQIFLEHVGQYQEQDHWGVYSIPENNFELRSQSNGKIDYYNYSYRHNKKMITNAMDNMITFFEQKFEYKFKKDNLRIHPEWFTLKGLDGYKTIDNKLEPFDYFEHLIINDGEGKQVFRDQLNEEYLTPTFSENEAQLRLIKSKLNAYLELKKEEFIQNTHHEYNLDKWVKTQLIDLYTNPNNKDIIYSNLGEDDDFSKNIIAQIFDVSFNKQTQYFAR
ncbi:hypothetical protein NXS15_01625 [Mycoplasma sp. CSL7475-4]|uniref:hypothetical protein n=1 Tax=Mycoplasma sp. CSL7475-4 TaxID=2973942 RepID=UPI00216B4212|nr:hypothetical protein [Mycoplasma sp. CSL7475-4]MCS4536822.1 hypothetical protein [Mycoplasma sp. CSL7475-4]